MTMFGIPSTEEQRRNASIQKYGDILPLRGTGKDIAPKKVSSVISPGKTVIITAITSAVTGAAGFAFSQGLSGNKVSFIPTLFVGFGAGILGGVGTLVALHFIKE